MKNLSGEREKNGEMGSKAVTPLFPNFPIFPSQEVLFLDFISN
jgi:hypothetical protein